MLTSVYKSTPLSVIKAGQVIKQVMFYNFTMLCQASTSWWNFEDFRNWVPKTATFICTWCAFSAHHLKVSLCWATYCIMSTACGQNICDSWLFVLWECSLRCTYTVANLVSLNILVVTTVSFLRRCLQERESTGYVNVCVRKDSDTPTDINVTVQTQSGTAQGEEMVNI